MRTYVVFCLISLIACTIASAQAVDVQGNRQPPQEESLKVYYLKHANSSWALTTLKQIGPSGQFVEDSRLNAIFVRASEKAHKEIVKLLETIDSQEEDKETTEILFSQAEDVEAGGELVSKFAEKSGVTVAFDKELGVFMIKGSKPDVERVREIIKVIGEQSQKSSAEKNTPHPYALRVLWLSNDPVEDSRNPFEPDAALKKSIQRLTDLGFSNMKVKMQLLGRCDMLQGKAQCQVAGSYASISRRTLDVQATLVDGGSGLVNGKLIFEASVDEHTAAAEAANQAEPAKTSVSVAIHLEPKKYYILSAAPIGVFQTAFVVQLIDEL